MRKFIEWHKDEKGQGVSEYVIIIGLISVVVIAVLLVVGPKITNTYKDVLDGLAVTSYVHTNHGNHYGHG